MIIKKILSEERLSLAEVKELLNEVKLRRSGDEEEEMSYELRRAIKHVEIFAHGATEESRSMVNELLELEKMTPAIALKIADIRPMNRDEIRAVYAKERFTLVDEDMGNILNIVLRG
ncbi:MAG: RNA polymerase Rpb4 family protein [Methanothrix sp.]|nr:MAG: RNA polymerase Rpb4 family protein [Methanothrix sp.]